MNSPWVNVLESTSQVRVDRKPLDWLTSGKPNKDGSYVVRLKVSLMHTFQAPPVLVLALREYDSWGFQAAGISVEVCKDAVPCYRIAVHCYRKDAHSCIDDSKLRGWTQKTCICLMHADVGSASA